MSQYSSSSPTVYKVNFAGGIDQGAAVYDVDGGAVRPVITISKSAL